LLYIPRTKLRKGLISYCKINGISTLKKHVDAKHGLLVKTFDEEGNSLVRTQVETRLIKKRQNVSSFEIFDFFITKLPYKKDEMQNKKDS
jgi:hypothetical protein